MKIVVTSLLLSILAAFGQQATTTPESQTTADPLVYVYRSQAVMKGRWLHPSIYCDGVELTRIYRGTFFKMSVPPGKHMVTLGRTEVGQFVNMESGKTYYFRFGHKNILVTAVSGREPLTLTLVEEATARQEMDGLKEDKNSK